MFAAAVYGQLGKMDETDAAVRRLLNLNGEFPDLARTALLQFVGLDDIVDRLIDGLSMAGMNIRDELPAADQYTDLWAQLTML